MDAKKLGQFISQIRKENHLTQVELANKLNVSDKTISKWETGRGIPDLIILDSLCEALNISIVELLKQERMNQESYNEDIINEICNEIINYNKRKKGSSLDYFILAIIFAIYIILFLFFLPFIREMYLVMYLIAVATLIVSLWRINNHETYIIPLTISILLFATLIYTHVPL